MLSDASMLETALKGLGGSIDVQIKVNDAELIDAVGLVDKLNAESANVVINANNQELINSQTLIERLDKDSASVDVDATYPELTRAQVLLDTLDRDSASVDIDATYQELINAENKIGDIDADSANVPITTETSDADKDIAKIKEDLSSLKTLAKIDILLNLPGNINDIISTISSIPGVGGAISAITETSDALTIVERRTGETITGLGAVIDRVAIETGAAKEDIANLFVEMVRNGETDLATLETSATNTFQLVRDEGVDAAAALQTANRLVATGLAENLDEAFQILDYGFQTGANRAGDFLDLIGEFGADFGQLGITGKETVDIVNAGMDAGAQNAGRVGEAYNGLAQNIETANEDTLKLIDNLKLDPDNLGVEGVQVLIDHVKSLTDETERAAAMSAVFSSGGTEIGESVIFALPDEATLQAKLGDFGHQTELTLTESFQAATDAFEQALGDALNNAIDLSGFLDKLKDAAITFSDEIQSGASIGEALEVSLALPEGQIARIESAIGNFLIGLLQAVANVGEFLHFDVSGIRANVAQAATQQLAFDIQLAESPEEIAGAFELAISRGVSSPEAKAAVSQAVDEMLAAGDIAGARQIVEDLVGVVDVGAIKDGLSSAGSQIIEGTRNTEHAIERLESAANAIGVSSERSAELNRDIELLRAAPTVDTSDLQTQVDTYVTELNTQLTTAIANQDWSGALDAAQLLGFDNAEQLVRDLKLSADLEGFKIPASIDFDPTAFDTNMEGITADITTELAGAGEQMESAGVGITVVSARIVDDVDTAEETVTSSVPTFTAAQGQITGTGVEISNVSMRIVDDAGTAATATTESSSEMNIAFGTIAVGSALLLVAQGNYSALESAISSSAPGMVSQLQQISDALSGFANAGGAALGVSGNLQTQGAGGAPSTGGTGSTPRTHAEGGVKREGEIGWTGEQGAELWTTDTDMAIINNQSSEAIWAMARQMSGGGGSSSVTNNYNINVINNNSNGAQGVNAGQMLYNKVRGLN